MAFRNGHDPDDPDLPLVGAHLVAEPLLLVRDLLTGLAEWAKKNL